jgi:SulP family sulfate permease
MITILEAYRNHLLTFHHWKRNILSGIIVGIVALPLAMAFAIASGVKPEQGIYTAIIAGIIVGLFGGTKVQIAGPTGAFVIVLSSIVAKYGVGGLQIATIMAGIMLLIMGLVKAGNMIKFIPYPVIVGFTSGIGVIIFVGEWKDFLGLHISLPLDAHFYEKLILTIKSFPTFDIPTTLLSCFCVFLILKSPRFFKKIPSPLVSMVIATGIVYIFPSFSFSTIGSVFGEIPQKLPMVELPHFDWSLLPTLIGPAITIALLGAIESLLSAVAADSITKDHHDSNRELIGQGLANVIAPFWGGFASTGAIARTVTNIRNGGNSPISAVVHSIFLILTLLVFAPFAIYIPFSALAAILCVVAFNMSDIPQFIYMIKKAPWYDVLVLWVTFFLTIFADLIIAVISGIALQSLITSVKAQKISTKTFKISIAPYFLEGGIIYDIDGPFFFGVAKKFESILAQTHTDPKFVIFNFKKVSFMDITGLETFLKIINDYDNRDVKVYIYGINQRVLNKISRFHILDKIQGNKAFDSIEEILEFNKK